MHRRSLELREIRHVETAIARAARHDDGARLHRLVVADTQQIAPAVLVRRDRSADLPGPVSPFRRRTSAPDCRRAPSAPFPKCRWEIRDSSRCARRRRPVRRRRGNRARSPTIPPTPHRRQQPIPPAPRRRSPRHRPSSHRSAAPGRCSARARSRWDCAAICHSGRARWADDAGRHESARSRSWRKSRYRNRARDAAGRFARETPASATRRHDRRGR